MAFGNRSTIRVKIVGVDNTGRAWASANKKVKGHQRKVGILTGKYKALTFQLKRINAILGVMPVSGAAGLAAVMGFLGKSIFDVGMKMDALRNSMIIATGSMIGAELEVRKIKALSKELGVNFLSTASAYKKFAIASKEVGMSSKTSDKIFRSVAKASAAMGLSSENTRLTLKALEQMISKGNVQAEELRGQLGEHLPGAFGMAAQAMGITTMELNKMLEQGELLATDLLPKLADVLENKFAAVAVRAAKQPRAALERLKNSWTLLMDAFNKSGFGKWVASLMDDLTKVFEDLTDNFDQYALDLIEMFETWQEAGYKFTTDSGWGRMFRNWATRAINFIYPIMQKGFLTIKGMVFDTFADINIMDLIWGESHRAVGAIRRDLELAKADVKKYLESAKKGEEAENYINAAMAVKKLTAELEKAETARSNFLGSLEPIEPLRLEGGEGGSMFAELKQTLLTGILEKAHMDRIEAFTEHLKEFGKEQGYLDAAQSLISYLRDGSLTAEEYKLQVRALVDAYAAFTPTNETLKEQDGLLTALKKKWAEFGGGTETVIKNLGDTLADIFGPNGTLVTGFADAFADSVVYAKNMDEAFTNLKRTIAKELVSALAKAGAQMAINWAKEKAMAVWQKTIYPAIEWVKTSSFITGQATRTSTSVAAAGTEAAAWSPAAALSSLASFGSNALPAIAGITAVLAMAKSFEGGGFTGGGARIGGIDGKGGFPAVLHPNETVVDHTRGQGNGKAVDVNFNITTVDATGFDDLLQSRRGMIVNMVNRAMNDRGMAGVTA